MKALDGSMMKSEHKQDSYILSGDIDESTTIANRILEILGENHPENLVTRKGIIKLVCMAMQVEGLTNPTDEQLLDFTEDAKNGAIHFNKTKAPEHSFI